MARLLEQRKQFTKNAIYDAAVAIATQEGPDALTMDRVAERAGVAKGSLYNYFPNKLELVRFVRSKLFDPVDAMSDEILSRDQSALDKLPAIFRAWFTFMNEHRGVMNLIFDYKTSHKSMQVDDLKEQKQPIEVLVRLIDQGISEGVFRPVDSKIYARLLFGALRDLCHEHILRHEPWAVDEMTAILSKFFLYGVRKTDV